MRFLQDVCHGMRRALFTGCPLVLPVLDFLLESCKSVTVGMSSVPPLDRLFGAGLIGVIISAM